MIKKRQRKLTLFIGLVVGALVDGYLRLMSGDDGNLLVHTVVFLGSALLVMGVVYGISLLRNVLFLKRKL